MSTPFLDKELEKDLDQDSLDPHELYESPIDPPEQSRKTLKNGSGVNVEKAQAEFAQLKREFSNFSEHSGKLSRTRSKRSEKEPKDVEKGLGSDDTQEEDEFDLESWLRGSKALEEETGIKDKHIGVLWDSLTVRGMGGTKNFVKTFPQAYVSFFNIFETVAHLFGYGGKGKEIEILKDFKGVVKPGEMVLVLGKPGSGCTTFLKVISNQRFGYTNISGDVLYGPFDSDFFGKRYRGEAVYCAEDENHLPTLTVDQTLRFALETKTPGKRPGGMSTSVFKDKMLDLLLKMFNIEHTRNTMVGNQFVRGVSGGERKRVSVAEMMVTGAPVQCWDNSTRGLDASTALDYAKSLRIITNIYRTTTFVSLYQASENIYSQFDKVMVIDDGRQVYFGPASEARAYFEGLGFLPKPRQTTPDYLTGCTDPYEREYQSGRSEKNAPASTEDLVEAFQKSKHALELNDEMSLYRKELTTHKTTFDDFQMAVTEGKRRAPNKSVYTIPFHLQVYALMQRQLFLKWQDKTSLAVSWITSIIIAIVLGTLYLNLGKTSGDAFPRGGLLFISLLFNAFQAFSELPSIMMGRPIVNKHRAYTFHRPSALWIAQIIVDMAYATAQITVFSIIVYFMTDLVRTPGAFFTFVLVIVSGYLSMTLFFRSIGCLCPDFDYALKLAAVLIMLMVLTTGYLIPMQSAQKWIDWFFWINALGLGFSALMMNEFQRIDLSCTAESLIPPYGSVEHKTCTLAGSSPGNLTIPGTRYIETAFSWNPSDLWRNWGIIVVLIVAFLLTNVFLGERVIWGAGGTTITFFAKENKERRKLNEALEEKQQRRLRNKADAYETDLEVSSKAVLTWEDICYDVPIPSGQIRLLRSIYGYVKPGQLTALMGASGAGKTTLLDVLAARKNVGVISGELLIDGRRPGIEFQRGTSYAEQLDILESTQTVREALRFSAYLRQPYSVPKLEKDTYVEEVISLLEMESIADAIIGSPETGLAVAQRKQVTIGIELAAKPELLLFLDEPTSGLDSQSAYNIVRFLKKLAGAGQAILCTIHQPNSALFESFDRLLLLQKGDTVYFGEIGKDARVLREYFHRYGADCPADANPAEWMLDAIGAGQQARIGDRDWGEIWRESEEFAAEKEEIVRLKGERLQTTGAQDQIGDKKEYATPLWHQIKLVTKRTSLSFWRTPNYGFTRWFNHAALAILGGLVYLQLDNSRASLQYRVFVIFQVTVLPALILAQVEPKYAMARMIFYRESAAKAYRQFPFALAMVLGELPYSIWCAVSFFLPLYYLPGLNPEPSRAGYQFFMILITELFAVTLGQMIAALTPSPITAARANPFIIITFALFCGVTIPTPQMPGFYKAWLYQLDPMTRLISGMVVTELHGQPVVCTDSELNRFTAPPGQTCNEYMGPFFNQGGAGYLVNGTSSDCSYCAYKVGDEFYTPLGISFDQRWRDLGIFLAFVGSNLIILFIGVSLLQLFQTPAAQP